jgi:hypothetical protein
MTTRPNLEAVAQELDKHEQRVRIKKLLLGACRKRWENNLHTLDSIELSALLRELYNLAPSLEKLTWVLINVVSRVNKLTAYFTLAHAIFCALRYTYPDSQIELNSIHQELTQNYGKQNSIEQLAIRKFLTYLKASIVKQTSLSQAKILIFSALTYQFNYSTQYWTLLNQQDFDSLSRKFFFTCTTLEEIEFKLYGAATYLEGANKNRETADLILKAVRTFYRNLQTSDRFNGLSIEVLNPTVQSSIKTEAKPFFESDEERTEIRLNGVPIGDSPPIATVSRLIQEVKTKIQEEARALSQSKVNNIRSLIEEHMQELEDFLEQSCHAIESDRYLSLKYNILIGFLDAVQGTSVKYLEILKSLEQK